MKGSMSIFVPVIAVAALSFSPHAAATTYTDTSAGAACSVANGGASNQFTRGNNYITNTGTTTQYVICYFPTMDPDGTLPATTYFTLAVSSTLANRTVLCSAQTGAYYQGTNHVISSNVRSYTFSGAGNAYLNWDASLIHRTNVYDVPTVNCRMDPGTRIGLFEYFH